MFILGDATISWCNRTSAWVSLRKPELADTVTRKLVRASSAKAPYTLLTWQEFSDRSRPKPNQSRVRKLLTSQSFAAIFGLVIALGLYFDKFWMK